jgi:ring-1,2-phenylacetyl-CoA epoxidase subunit PaaC
MNATYILHLADNALIHGQRIAEWCGHGPVLEEDIAMANIGLDHIGQARMLYQHAAEQIGGGATEDSLAYFRDAHEFRNYVLLELPHQTAFAPSVKTPRDYSVTITRNFLYSSLMSLVWQGLQNSKDEQLAAIAAKSSKEVRYHLRHSTDWMLRLGDGTPQSHIKMQAALDYLMPYTQEFFTPSALEQEAAAQGIGMEMSGLRDAWQTAVATVLTEATLRMSPASGHIPRGKEGQHSEHLSYLLAEMQSLARAHPGAVW